MTTLLLVRHGETDWNRDGRWQGGSDTSLNDARSRTSPFAGRPARRRTSTWSIRATWPERARLRTSSRRSSASRCESTRDCASGASASWEGLTTPEIEERFADSHRRWLAGEGPGADDAETFEDFSARVNDFLADVLRLHPGEEVLVISHGGSIRVIHALAAGLDYVRDHKLIPGVANCAVARYVARDGKLAPLD